MRASPKTRGYALPPGRVPDTSWSLTHDQNLLVARETKVAHAALRHYLGKYPHMLPFREDLKQDAYMGLMQAARGYDPERGSFGAFAYSYARAYMGLAAPAYLHSVRVPKDLPAAYKTSGSSLDLAAALSEDPRETEDVIGVEDLSEDLKGRLTALVGERNANLWWAVTIGEEAQADEARRYGIHRQQVHQIMHRTTRIFAEMTEDLRREA